MYQCSAHKLMPSSIWQQHTPHQLQPNNHSTHTLVLQGCCAGCQSTCCGALTPSVACSACRTRSCLLEAAGCSADLVCRGLLASVSTLTTGADCSCPLKNLHRLCKDSCWHAGFPEAKVCSSSCKVAQRPYNALSVISATSFAALHFNACPLKPLPLC